MKLLHSSLHRVGPRVAFVLALFAVFFGLMFRNAGIYPTVFGDEWTYSSFARLLPFSEALIPDYLYYSVYSVTNACGTAFLECSRSLNALFYVGAAPFLYLILRRVCGPRTAAVLTLLIALRPGNTYTLYFMPEAMYYFTFWAFSWLALQIAERQGPRNVALGAALLGAMSLVKVHAVFLLPAWLVFLLYGAWRNPGPRHWLARGIGHVALALAVAAIVRFGLGWLYGGADGLHLLGRMYSGQANARPGLDEMIPAALSNLSGHLFGLALLLGVPLATQLLPVVSRVARTAQPRPANALAVYTVLVLGALIGTTVLFTAAVAGHGSESNARLHMRYYDFALPLLLMLAACWLPRRLQQPALPQRLLAALVPAALLAGAWLVLPAAFTPNHIDSPELFGAVADRGWLAALACAAGLSLAGWVLDLRRGVQAFLFGFVPLLLLLSGTVVTNKLREAAVADDYVKGGLYARDYLRRREQDRLVILGDDIGQLFKSRFLVDNPNVKLVQLAPGAPADPATFAGAGSYGLIIGDHMPPPNAILHSGRRGFALVRLAPPNPERVMLDFQTNDMPPDVTVTGLSRPEDWGRWSNGPKVTVQFARPLPRKLRLVMRAGAFGPNADKEIGLMVQGRRYPIRVGGDPQRVELDIDTDGTADRIEFDIPAPTSPQALAGGNDDRQLGLSFYWLYVEPRKS